jgi:CRISPR-associated protein Csx16
MTTFLITRHPAAIEWVESQGVSADKVVTHLNSTQDLDAGDKVLGTLPIHLVAELTHRGVEYWHLSLSLLPELRGKELSLTELQQCQPCLQQFEVHRK